MEVDVDTSNFQTKTLYWVGELHFHDSVYSGLSFDKVIFKYKNQKNIKVKHKSFLIPVSKNDIDFFNKFFVMMKK